MKRRASPPSVVAARLAALVVPIALAAPLGAQQRDFAIDWERYELANGLEVVLLPDSTREDVAVELWTHAGTRHEPAGKFGLAHFFEHVLPHGTLLRSGAVSALADSLRTGSNARTRDDYTRYYQRTTREGTGLFLLLAANRLGSDPAVDLTPERVEHQRERVLAEMARFVNARWGEPVSARLARGTFGAGHPYAHAAYATPEETNATTRDDLVRWQRAHVRPEYTTLFVAGGFDARSARVLIQAAFGRIPGGTRPPREAPRVPRATGGRDTLSVAADESLLFLAWPTPRWAHEHTPLLELFAHALSDRLADAPPPGVTATSVEPVGQELAGSFTVVVAHAPGADAAAIESWVRGTLDGALERLTEAQVESARRAERERIGAYLDELGWIGGRIELVGESLVFSGDPGRYRDHLARQETAAPGEVLEAARAWLTAPAYVLTVTGRESAP